MLTAVLFGIFLPAFLAISIVVGKSESFFVFCGSPLTRMTASSGKFWPITISFLPFTWALRILGESSDWRADARVVGPVSKQRTPAASRKTLMNVADNLISLSLPQVPLRLLHRRAATRAEL